MDLHVKGRTNCPPLQDQLDKIQREESIDDAFSTLHSCDSFFNYHTVKHIIDNLGNESDKSKLKRYERALDEYCQRNIWVSTFFNFWSRQKIAGVKGWWASIPIVYSWITKSLSSKFSSSSWFGRAYLACHSRKRLFKKYFSNSSFCMDVILWLTFLLYWRHWHKVVV